VYLLLLNFQGYGLQSQAGSLAGHLLGISCHCLLMLRLLLAASALAGAAGVWALHVMLLVLLLLLLGQCWR
jgi:hypothetical protein